VVAATEKMCGKLELVNKPTRAAIRAKDEVSVLDEAGT
jgi:hypothetical protein